MSQESFRHLHERRHDIGTGTFVKQVLPLFLPEGIEPARCQHKLNRVEKVGLAGSVAANDGIVLRASEGREVHAHEEFNERGRRKMVLIWKFNQFYMQHRLHARVWDREIKLL